MDRDLATREMLHSHLVLGRTDSRGRLSWWEGLCAVLALQLSMSPMAAYSRDLQLPFVVAL